LKKEHKHIVSKIIPGSIAEEMEIEAGDVLISINGQVVADIFDYQFLEAEEEITSLKKDRNAIINSYQSKIRMNIILADILLLLGIAILTFGIYMKHKMDVNPKAIEILQKAVICDKNYDKAYNNLEYLCKKNDCMDMMMVPAAIRNSKTISDIKKADNITERAANAYEDYEWDE